MGSIEPVVKLEKDDQIAIIILNRSEKLNAFNVEMRDQLYEIIQITLLQGHLPAYHLLYL